MLQLFLTAALALPLQSKEDAPKPPDPKVVEAAVESLRAAQKSKEAPDRVAAVQGAAKVSDAEVIKGIGKYFGDKDSTVRMAVVDALRYSPHPDALALLENKLKRDKKLRKDEELYPAVVKAIGQHGKESSIDVLNDRVTETGPAMQARIYGLGHIRSKKSVEALFRLMSSRGRRKTGPMMDEIRLSLMVLTGVDRGKSQDAWFQWWNENKKTFEVKKEPGLLPKLEQNRWDRYWGYQYKRDRGKKRGDRGNDPERD